jgi:hypothetical protein
MAHNVMPQVWFVVRVRTRAMRRAGPRCGGAPSRMHRGVAVRSRAALCRARVRPAA